jgi:hypothetical protein
MYPENLLLQIIGEMYVDNYLMQKTIESMSPLTPPKESEEENEIKDAQTGDTL